jgi:hypothetical protein
MNFYGTETTDQHTLAGRIIPLLEAMFQSVSMAGGQPVKEPKYSTVLPAWAHKICDKLTKTIFKNLVETAPRENQFIARHYGQLVGMLLRGVVFYFKEVPALLKKDGLLDLTEEQETKLERFSGMPLLVLAASETLQKPISNKDELIEAGEQIVEKQAEDNLSQLFLVLRHLLDRPVEEQYQFLRGIPEGFKAFLNSRSEFTGEKRRIEVYLALFRYWPEIVEMQKSQPPKTRKDLLEWLEKQEERQLVTDPKQFYELCDEIDLDMAPAGHPFTAPPA